MPRLSRLLHRHQFEEAERFAIAFKLDVEVRGFSSSFNLLRPGVLDFCRVRMLFEKTMDILHVTVL